VDEINDGGGLDVEAGAGGVFALEAIEPEEEEAETMSCSVFASLREAIDDVGEDQARTLGG
jgi:hypothetical protein